MFRIVKVLTVVALFVMAAYGGTVTIGIAGGGNCYPFTCNDSGTASGQSIEYQQVYTSSAFGVSPYSITSVQFPDAYVATHSSTAGPVISGNYAISFAVTNKAVNGLSTTLSCNITSGQP